MIKIFIRNFGLLFFLAFSAAVISKTSNAEQRGYLMSRDCPFSCRTEGIDKKHCKDWRVGNRCYVEDLNRSENHPAPSIPIAPSNNGQRPVQSQPGFSPWGSSSGYLNDKNNNEYKECRSGKYLASPRVNVYRTKSSGNIFGDKYKVRGSVEGVCLIEAGYFEYGNKRDNIPVSTSRNFKRFEFEIAVRASEKPEIRVYNINGDMDFIEIDPQQY